MKKITIIILAVIITFTMTSATYAHPGRTDRKGCHTCKTNCKKRGLQQGEYHCHNRK